MLLIPRVLNSVGYYVLGYLVLYVTNLVAFVQSVTMFLGM